MAKGRIARISAGTVGVHRIIGRNSDGVNIEEKVCPIVGELFVTRAGNVAHHPLECGRVASPDGARYGQGLREEGIRDHGWLPLGECPYTERYHHLVKGPLVAPPDGERDCGGKPDGCEHLHRVMTERRARSQVDARARKATRDGAGAAQLVKLGESIARWTEVQMAGAPSVAAARTRLREGRGEEAR
jgi:hypothetical protein